MLKIALAQTDPVVGAFEANIKKIKEAYQRACSKQARLLITPELGICGYPPYDLLDRPEMFERNEKAIEDLAGVTRGQKCALAVGSISKSPFEFGRSAQNSVTILEDGKRVFRQAKALLPTYDVFDEARYFEPAPDIHLWNCDGIRVGVAICEDLWSSLPHFGKKLYAKDPVAFYRDQKADLILSLSSSPYEWNKRERREGLHRDIAMNLGIPLIYVNQMGSTDELLFDGGSFAFDGQGQLIGRLPFFRTSFGVVSVLGPSSPTFEIPSPEGREDESPSEIEILTRGLVTGIREYFKRTGFKKAIIGLSGGIDSAVIAVLATQALGAKNVLGVAMPSQYSSSHSLEDAEILASKLGIRFEVRPIKFLFSTSSRELAEGRGSLAPVALENLQSRLRGVMLMTLANHDSSLVLTTGNKSELAMGYCTMYGDMAGALAPIGDVFKTRVYELARYMNQIWGNPIPERTLIKPPSAELRPNQTDQDTLPPYEVLDELLSEYIENGTPIAELEERFSAHSIGNFNSIHEILGRLEINEYKRRQAAPVLKVSRKAFGIGRRVPIAKVWDRTE
jgi:NAD+ synthetase